MSVALWTSPAFVADARDWVAAKVTEHGGRLTGEWRQPHARAWSSAIRFETSLGRVWLKVNGSGTAFEARLLAALGELSPGLVPDVLAVDDERAWTLLRDGGPLLRAVHPPEESWEPWEQLLARYAAAQRGLSDHLPRLLATDVPDLAPPRLLEHFCRLRDELRGKPVDDGGLDGEEAAALDSLEPAYADWCAELEASPVRPSVQHDDLHSANVCWPGPDASTARIIDWGDASVAHPFGTMLATLNSIAFHAGLLREDSTFDDPRMDRVRDAYLEPFTDLAPAGDLRRWVELARRTGCVSRALSYVSALADADDAVAREMEFPVRDWLRALLEPWATAPLG
jgi:hypothetical protein